MGVYCGLETGGTPLRRDISVACVLGTVGYRHMD
jgi:hypothetical protein